jgi:hypothetical protein
MKSEDKEKAAGGENVVDLAAFRQKKNVEDELTRGGRNPLYVSHLTGKVTGSPHLKGPESPDFGDRLQRIRSSLEKINRLMSELKRMSTEDATPSAPSSNRSQT